MRHRITAATATTVSVAAIVAGCSGGSGDDPVGASVSARSTRGELAAAANSS